MEPWLIGLISGFIILVLLLIGVPVAYALGLVGLGLIAVGGSAAGLGYLLPTAAFYHLASFALIALPLFILLSSFMITSGMGYELFEFAHRWIGRLPGALATASVVGCAGFAALSGSSVATAAAIGGVAIPEMISRGYNPRLAFGAVAAGGTMGILIPPSLQFIMYGVLSETNIGALFMAGVIPGVIMTTVLGLYITLLCKWRPALASTPTKATWPQRLTALRRMWTVLVLVGFVLGGIFFGIVTPTEASAVGAFVALLLGIFYFRKLKKSNIYEASISAVYTTAMVGFIIVGAVVFGRGLTLVGVTTQIIDIIQGLAVAPIVVIIFINILLLILGFFMDGAAITIVMTPLLAPVVAALGFDLIWFGVVMCINIEIGLMTPPVGMNLFVIHGITGAPMGEIIRGALPFMGLLLIVLILIIAFPILCLWLPGLMG